MTEESSVLDGRGAGAVHLVGGRLCLDFINSIGARRPSPSGAMTIRDEKLRDYFDLLAWARHAGALTDSQAEMFAREGSRRRTNAADAFHRAVRLREALYCILKAVVLKKEPEHSHLRLLNEELCLVRKAERLVFEKAHFAWRWSASKSLLDRVVWPVASSAAELLTLGDLTRLRQCAGDDCGWIFEDTSRNRSRRWCEMRDCGNAAKVRRFRLRQHLHQ